MTRSPLNEGCLAPLEIVSPAGSFPGPGAGSAVVAGNTEISQAIACALLRRARRAGQRPGDDEQFPVRQRPGISTTRRSAAAPAPAAASTAASAVHTHMTNTRITDPEVLELRYPVRLERFAIRTRLGRRRPLSRRRWRRARDPRPGADDGDSRRLATHRGAVRACRRADGATGRQWIERADGALDAMSGHDRVELAAGDLVVIETPGGGGYGTNPGDAPGSNDVAHPPIDS